MLLSKPRFALCLFLCVGFLSGNAQVHELVKELKNNPKSLSLSGVKDPARGNPYEIITSGNVISFYKTITTVVKVPSSDSRMDRIAQALKEGRITPEQAKRLKERAKSMSEGRSESTGRSGRSGSEGSRSRAGSAQNKSTTKTERKLMAKLDLLKVDPSAVIVTSNGRVGYINFEGPGAIRYYESASRTYKTKNKLTIEIPYYGKTEKLKTVVKNAVLSVSPRKDIRMYCSGNVHMMPYLSVRIWDKDKNGVFREQHAKFKVVGKRGELTVRKVPLGTHLRIQIDWPNQGPQAEAPVIFQEYKMPPTLGRWNALRQSRGKDPIIQIDKRI